MTRQTLISVIVPIYNVERYLKTCIDSILAQSYQNFEIVLVDDGSPDGCPAICDAYAAQDERVRVLHKKNGGLSLARGSGVAASKGDYIAFVDADDFIHPCCLEMLLNSCVKDDSGVCICRVCRVDESTSLTDNIAVPPPLSISKPECVTGREANMRLYGNTWAVETVAAWAKLYRRDLFEGIDFPDVPIHEDEALTYKLLYRAQRVSYLDAELYFYRTNPNGIMAQRYAEKNLEKQLALIPICEERMRFYRSHDEEELCAKLLDWEFWMLYGRICDILGKTEKAKAVRKKMKKALRQCYWELQCRKDISQRKRLSYTKYLLKAAVHD